MPFFTPPLPPTTATTANSATTDKWFFFHSSVIATISICYSTISSNPQLPEPKTAKGAIFHPTTTATSTTTTATTTAKIPISNLLLNDLRKKGGRVVNYIIINGAVRKGLHHE
eukprot:10629131-Ditylum_brightwellii.AAC.1